MMRKILASVLIVVMFASATLCVCGHAALAQSISWHHHDAPGHHDKNSPGQDCQQKEMQLPGCASVVKSDLTNTLHVYDFAALQTPSPSPPLTRNRVIRGPPPWGDAPNATPAILRITQRLLI